MRESLPYQNDGKNKTVVRGILDLISNFRLLIESNFGDCESDIFESILKYINPECSCENQNFPDVHIAADWQEFFLDESITIQEGSVIYNPAIDSLQFMSKNNNPGNLLTRKENNLSGFNNSDIATTYKGFENVYSIIQFLLDLIINKLILNEVIFDVKTVSNNEEIILDSYIKYLEDMIKKYNGYLLLVTNQKSKIATDINTHVNTYVNTYVNTDANTYVNSYIFNRIHRLLWDGNIHKPAEFAWAKYIGYDLIDELSIKIGGQLIDKHNYQWMYLDYLTNKKLSQKRGHDIMVGNIPELNNYDSSPKKSATLYIPVQLWFCKNINESLPLLCMRYTDVEITAKIRALNKVAYWEYDDTFFRKRAFYRLLLTR